MCELNERQVEEFLERLFAMIQLERWEINGHNGTGCGEGSESRTTGLSHD